MRAAIYNPYLDTLGGGERYTVCFGLSLVKLGYEVDLYWNDKSIKDKIESRFGMSLNKINIVSDIKKGSGYDLCFWVSDGSIPILSARNNLIHFQVPFVNVDGKSLLNKMKLFRVKKVICNSYFTKKVIDDEFGLNTYVLYPPVSVNDFKSDKKDNIILSIGRFSQLTQAKRQDVLVSAFKKLYTTDDKFKSWKLILIGGADIGAKAYVNKLKKMSQGYPIEIQTSVDYETIKKYYSKAKLFWTASGFGIDQNREPQKVEHFGMALVEAMAAGAVVFAYKAGGHNEIIENNSDGFLWNDQAELIEKTANIISNPKFVKQITKNAIRKSKLFSVDVFTDKLRQMI